MRFMNDYDIEYARQRYTRSNTPNRLGNGRVDRYGNRQPRPQSPRTGTRFGVIRAALLEG